MKNIVLVFFTLVNVSLFAQSPYHISVEGGGMMNGNTYLNNVYGFSFSRLVSTNNVGSVVRIGTDVSFNNNFRKDTTQKESIFQKYAVFAGWGTEKEEYGYLFSAGPSYLNARGVSCIGLDLNVRLWASLYQNICFGVKIGGNYNKQYSFGQFDIFLMYKF
ncbi:MAG: hypothetical protein FWD66_05050 [Paludibacter sp.]|nr:hypothetical protein [Paludibacter sp.]